MPRISIIVAIAENYAIGKNNDLLWHIPDDLKRFKRITSGSPVIMGRNTYLSLPIRPLPKRKNIVISDRQGESFEGCHMAYSIDESIALMDKEKENFIIGGGMVYSLFMPIAHKLYITKVHKSYEADVFFPEIDHVIWQKVSSEAMVQEKPQPIRFSYEIYERNI